MPEITQLQTSFTSGELSPKLKGRTDLTKYFSGAETIQNYIVSPHGGVSRRPGTRFIAEVKDSSKFTRLVPFTYSTVQAYILEFGDQYIRFYRDQGQILSGPSPLELATPYTEADLLDLHFVQSADVLIITHPDFHPQELQRLSDTNWQLVDFDFEGGDGPYMDINDTAITLTPSGTTGSVTITASASLFVATDVGRLVRIFSNSLWGYAEITAYTSDTQVTATVVNAFGNTSSSLLWRLGAWSDTTGWPFVAAFYQGRAFFGGTDTQPQTIWASASGDFNDFAPSAVGGTVADSNGLSFTIDDDQVNAIRWLSAMPKTFAIGTASAEYTVNRGQTSETITPTNIKVSRETVYGSSIEAVPRRVGRIILYVDASSEKVRSFNYSIEGDSFISEDTTILAEHISIGGILETSYQQSPDSIFWCARDDGTLLGLTVEQQQEVFAWHRHILGGSYSGGQAVVDSIATILETFNFETWMIVIRTINGQTKRYVELLQQPFRNTLQDQDEAFFVDSGLSYDGAPASSFAGLDHLEGETVAVLADGATHPNVVVTAGAVTLEREASVVHIGLAYTSKLTTMPIFTETDSGPTKGKTKRISRVHIQLHETLGLKVGIAEDKLQVISFRKPSDLMGDPPVLFSGLKTVDIPGGYGREIQFMFQQDQPLPGTVLSVAMEAQVHER